MDKEIVKVLESSGLEKSQAESVMVGFNTFFEEVKRYEQRAKSILVTDASQVAEIKEAREIRIELKNIRVHAEKVRVERKEFFLRGGKAIDGIANVLKALIIPLEDHLDKQEHFAERMEEERKERVNAERMLALQPYVIDIAVYNLKDMTDGAFEVLLRTSKTAFEATKDAEKKAVEEQVAREKADKEEQERIRLENEKLKKEAEAKEKAFAKERAKAEVERKKIEEAQIKEREAKEKAEAELKAKVEADEKAKRDKEELERKSVEEKSKLDKQEKYRAFRSENGWNEKTKNDFKEENTGTEIILWKKIANFKL